MWREIDPRAPERERPEPGLGRVSGQTEMESKAVSDDPRDAFTRDLDLPRGSSRERVRANDKEYRLSGDDVRVLATVGAFRVVPAGDLREPNARTPTRPARDLERLRDLGLVQTVPYVVGRARTTLVTLTGHGRDVLEGARRPGAGSDRQAFYVGITKPRELAHDSRVYSAYMKAGERLAERGEPVRRVVLEEELKREYQRFLQAENRARREGGETPEERSDAVARWAQEHQLPYEDGHVQFPDARLEYDGRDGRRSVEDIEVVTPHYRGAHAAAKGFTELQAGFLVTVMLHSGVCVRRQYCVYARIAHGQKDHDFFASLVAKKRATSYAAAHRRAHIYHVHNKSLYAAIGEPNNRNRKPVTLARAIERLMVLDTVLAERRLQWLGAERDKVEYFSTTTSLRLKELPHLVFGAGPEKTIRYFPDKLPIGITGDGRTHVFVYLVNRKTPVDFRAFLHRHSELLRALPEWELRLLVPRHLLEAAPLFEQAARDELGRPLRLDDVAELRWYFRQQDQIDHGGAPEDFRRFRRACRAFRAPRFNGLYRVWKKNGDRPLDATVSPVLEDKIARRRGHVTSEALVHLYAHLSPLVGSA